MWALDGDVVAVVAVVVVVVVVVVIVVVVKYCNKGVHRVLLKSASPITPRLPNTKREVVFGPHNNT